MAELKNVFSWSFSAGSDFEECRRRRYWAKYAMWGGWNRDASVLQRTAYRLTKMDNRYTLRGRAVEEAAMFLLREVQQGREPSAERAYQEIARPLLNRAWKESRDKRWQEHPKKYANLHEHYYPQHLPEQQQEWPATIAGDVKTCIDHFIATGLPRLGHVRPEQEVPVTTAQAGGDPESFTFHGVKVYAIPDYVYREECDGETLWHIHDWKSGRHSDKHLRQLGIYGLWAHTVHGVPAEQLRLHIEYLLDGTVESAELTEADLEETAAYIEESVAEMTEYLVGYNRDQNRPVSRDEWDLAADPRACLRCSFYELCEPELREQA